MDDEAGTADLNRYQQIMERIFFSHYVPHSHEVEFARSEMVQVAKELGIDLPKNLGDVVYSFRYRTPLPLSILRTAPEGQEWVIRPAGRGRYRFQIAAQVNIIPNPHLHKTKVPQDIALCKAKFPNLICRPLAAQQMENDAIALFEFMKMDDVTEIAKELHYRLVARDNMTLTDVEAYRSLSSQSI